VFASVGGVLSLYLGVAVIFIFEWLEVAWDLLYAIVVQKKQKKK
jgi:hypothetical protein